MKKILPIVVAVFAVSLAAAPSQVPSILNYQGRVTVGGTNFNGIGQFKFALVRNDNTFVWRNDGAATSGEPATAVGALVQQGLYATLLGDTTLSNMAAIPAEVFTNSNIGLRVWFSAGGTNPFVLLTPDQRIGSAGYALRAASAESAAIANVTGDLSVGGTLRAGKVIGGSNNTSGANGTGAVIAGGEYNTANFPYATIGGGYANLARDNATIAGGQYNTARGDTAAIGGGFLNYANGDYSFVGGGYNNTNGAAYAVLVGGNGNTNTGEASFLGGGQNNSASGYAAFVGGGYNNTASANYASVGGGRDNANSGNSASVSGGRQNTASEVYATVSGGQQNTASGMGSSVGGGFNNTNNGYAASIGGGQQNKASGLGATIPGGLNNTATNYAFAAGRRAKADDTGAFVWADSTDADFGSTSSNQFLIRAGGGVGINTNDPGTNALSVEGPARFSGPVEIEVNGTTIRVQSDGRVVIQAAGNLDLQAGGDVSISGDNVTVDSASRQTVLGSASPMITVLGGTLPPSSAFAGTNVATFQIGKYEVTWNEWLRVRAWAVGHGYSDLAAAGSAIAGDHPVASINWNDAAKWCNAKSEMEGLSPVYFLGGSTYRTGKPVVAAQTGGLNLSVNIGATGYRLPTEAEWEWAARGGVNSQGYTFSGGNVAGKVAWYLGISDGSSPSVEEEDLHWRSSKSAMPVGTKMPNELGIHDMSGNVWEFCQEVDIDKGNLTPRRRGGSWNNMALPALDDNAGVGIAPIESVGLRLARNAAP